MMDMLTAQQKWLVHMSQDYYLESIRLAKAMGGLVSNETEEFARTIEETEQRAAA